MANHYTDSEIRILRPRRPFHHSIQASLSASITMELGFMGWRMKDCGEYKFPGPFPDAVPDWARNK